MPDTIQFTQEAIRTYLDRCIEFWRKKKNAGNFIAMSYIDAYQSVRTSLFGETLSAVDGDMTTKEFTEMTERKIYDIIMRGIIMRGRDIRPVVTVQKILKALVNE